MSQDKRKYREEAERLLGKEKNFNEEVCMWRDNSDIVKEVRGKCMGYNKMHKKSIEVLAKVLEEKADCEGCRDLRTILSAWHDTFGTTQLTHAIDNLESKDKQIAELTAEVKKGMVMALRVEELQAQLTQAQTKEEK